ncbi:MAG TPA: alanine--tRNA ligase-related protein, partial [Kribbella sp.]
METSEIRRRFLQYFEDRGHTVVPSAPLPSPDPNLLFNVAGMAQFVPYFVGQQTPPYARATSVQKCVRTLDIDEVGKTTRHGTFFQMNGNFSFGDYFKEKAIEYAWELVTKPQHEGGYGFDESVLYASVYYDDDEAIDLWKRVAGLPDDRIVRLGMKDNFWSMGIPGPCGPCSEILIDRGPEFGADRDWEAGDRYLEFWNLVFMQNIRGEGGGKDGYPIIGELPKKNIDTGLGLERVAYLLQGVDNMYEIDEIYPVIEKASELSGRKYGAEHTDDVRFRVVADHVRSALMLIGDGVTPGNEQGGYVLRRLLRRAIRSMRLLGYEDP